MIFPNHHHHRLLYNNKRLFFLSLFSSKKKERRKSWSNSMIFFLECFHMSGIFIDHRSSKIIHRFDNKIKLSNRLILLYVNFCFLLFFSHTMSFIQVIPIGMLNVFVSLWQKKKTERKKMQLTTHQSFSLLLFLSILMLWNKEWWCEDFVAVVVYTWSFQQQQLRISSGKIVEKIHFCSGYWITFFLLLLTFLLIFLVKMQWW